MATYEKKKKYKVVYDRLNCIEVLSCVAVYPERWKADNDGKASLVGGVEDSKNPKTWYLEFSEEELEKFKSSAEVCPAKVISIIDLETGEKLV